MIKFGLKSFGLEEDLYELGAYILGGGNVPQIQFQPDGNWERYLPKYEPQAEDYETSGCTVWGAQNQIEIFIKRVYGYEPNYSERFTYNVVGIDPHRGTDPQNTYEAIRKFGLIPNELFPVPPTIREFTDASKITSTMMDVGREWVNKHDFKHEWLWQMQPSNYMEVLKENLKRSPLGVSVTAWRENTDTDGNEVYVSDIGGNNHWCVLYKFDKDGYPWVFDSYDHSTKRLSKDHNIRRAKVINIKSNTRRGLASYLKILQNLVNRLRKKPMDLATLCELKLGTDVSPRDQAPDDLACAESATTLMREVYPETPILISTNALYHYLMTPENNWVQTDKADRNAVIISPTGYGKKGTHGHVGICLNTQRIASNQSKTGTLEVHLTVDYWKEYYGTLGYPVLYFMHT